MPIHVYFIVMSMDPDPYKSRRTKIPLNFSGKLFSNEPSDYGTEHYNADHALTWSGLPNPNLGSGLFWFCCVLGLVGHSIHNNFIKPVNFVIYKSTRRI